ncbi:MAG: hypothetical protein K0Q76_198 [Panacagrimonas sp.]|jgi:hypothetical protein|nr:hypothetical protein [Panacagrimonas sp.]MCC2655090.1 hypothetical protein [Panacagrimonas sp.]
MNIQRSMRFVLLSSIAALPLGGAIAAPQITPLGEADKHGYIVYSVKCDDGRKKILQCVRDDRHCGYAGDQALSDVVTETCSATPAQASEPPSSDDTLPFQTAPAQP